MKCGLVPVTGWLATTIKITARDTEGHNGVTASYEFINFLDCGPRMVCMTGMKAKDSFKADLAN